ncbi:MAG: hypothetical protein IPK26_13245 [Planctomycetes bacterium]|nr:hypothetical protein [Planctomycetota bacterium]
MHRHHPPAALLALVMLATGAPAIAQDMVTLHSVTIDANNDVRVVYSKNFATCAHMRFSDAACAQSGSLTHVANHFCTSGTMVTIIVPLTVFTAGFGAGSSVFMHHGNNGGVRSTCVTVGCDGTYGSGCPGSGGVPVLSAVDACPPAGGTLSLALSNGPVGSVAILGFGLSPTSLPLFGCNLLVAGIGGTFFLPLDGAGAASFAALVPAGTSGISITSQAFVLDNSGPQGFSATAGLVIRVR